MAVNVPRPPFGAITANSNGGAITGLTLTNSDATCTAIDTQNISSGIVITPASLSSTALDFYISHDGTTYVKLYTAASAAVALTVDNAAKAYPIPASVFPSKYLKIVAGSPETGKTLTVILST